MGFDTTWTLDDLDTIISRRLMLIVGRCIFGVVLTPEAAWPALTGHLTELALRNGAAPDQIEIVAFDGGEWTRRHVLRLNQDRTSILARLRLLVFLVPDAERLRLLLHSTPDLNTSPDFMGELRVEQDRPWEEVEAAVRDLMIAQHHAIDLVGLLPHDTDHHAIPLADLYMPLVDFEEDWTEAFPWPWEFFEVPPEWQQQMGHLFDPLALHERQRSWLILGNPGTGKTTALRHVALMAAQGTPVKTLPPHRTAVLLPLAEWAEVQALDRVMDLPTFLCRWLEARGVLGARALLEHLDETALLLDGLDEVRSPSFRRQVVEEVRALLGRGLACAVVTARPFVLDSPNAGLSEMEVVHMRQPSGEELERFVYAFGQARRRPEAALRALTGQLLTHPALRSLASTPLVLAFLCVLDEISGRLPEHRVEIYYRLSELLVERWRVARTLAGEPTAPRPSRGDVLRVLGPLALWMLARGGAPVPDHALLEELARIELARNEDLGAATDRARRLLDLLKADTALLQRAPDGRWSFVHLSLVEYFAAVETSRDPTRWAALLADPFQPEQREVLLLLAGILGLLEGLVHRLDELCDAVLAHSKRRGNYPAGYPLLLIDLLRDIPPLSTRHQRALLHRVFEFVLTIHFSEAATDEVQEAMIGLMRSAASSDLRAPMQEVARAWFAPPSGKIAWERVSRNGLQHATNEAREYFITPLDSHERPWDGTGTFSVKIPTSALRAELPKISGSAGLLLDALPELLDGLGVPITPELNDHIGRFKEHSRHGGWNAAIDLVHSFLSRFVSKSE